VGKATGKDRSPYQCPATLLGRALTQTAPVPAAQQADRKLSGKTPLSDSPASGCHLPGQSHWSHGMSPPWLAPHGNGQLLQLRPSTPAPGPSPGRVTRWPLAPQGCSPCPRRLSAAEISKGSFAFDVESRLPALRPPSKHPSAGPCPSQRRRKVKSRRRQGKLISRRALLRPGLKPGFPAKKDSFLSH